MLLLACLHVDSNCVAGACCFRWWLVVVRLAGHSTTSLSDVAFPTEGSLVVVSFLLLGFPFDDSGEVFDGHDADGPPLSGEISRRTLGAMTRPPATGVRRHRRMRGRLSDRVRPSGAFTWACIQPNPLLDLRLKSVWNPFEVRLKSVVTLTGSFPALCARLQLPADMASHEGGDSGKTPARKGQGKK